MIGGPSMRRGGLGQVDPYQVWVQSLPPSCWLNNDPSSGQIICPAPQSVLAATAALPEHQPSALNYVNPTVASTASNPTFVTAQVLDAPTLTANTANLSGHLAQAVMEALATPGTLAAVGDPTAYLQAIANAYCALYGNMAGGGDTQCGQASTLVAQFAQQLQTAINQHAAAVQAQTAAIVSGGTPAPAPGTTGSNQSTSVNAATQPAGSCPQGSHWVNDGTSWSCKPLPPAPPTPTIVNPSPASQPTTTGSSVASPVSVLSQANGTTLVTGTPSTDIIAGVPNAVLFIGGGALALILLLELGKK